MNGELLAVIYEELDIIPEFHQEGKKDLKISIDEIDKIIEIVKREQGSK